MANQVSLREFNESFKRSGLSQGPRIKALYKIANKHFVNVCNEHNLDKGDVSKVVDGKRQTSRIKDSIAQDLDIPVEELFV